MGNEYSIGPWETELELELAEYRQKFGETPATEFLSRAADADDSYGKKKLTDVQKEQRLAETVEWARRESQIGNDDIERLMAVVGTVSESSFECGYVLSSMLLAAAVGQADLQTRINAAVVAGNAASGFKKWEATKVAFLDCLESLRLLLRFFQADEASAREMEVGILRAWSEVREELGAPSQIFDLPDDTASGVLLQHVVWNTDFGPHNRGHLPQTDALARLVIRLEHWLEAQNGDALQLARAWGIELASNLPIPDCEVAEAGRARCTVTCADALLETGSYEAALLLYDQVLQPVDDSSNPMFAHVLINQALAQYQLGRKEAAQKTFAAINSKSLKAVADIVITLKAEWARYIAARSVLRVKRLSSAESEKTTADVEEAVRDIAGMLIGSSSGRTGHLRSLFVGQIARDTAGILALRKYRSA